MNKMRENSIDIVKLSYCPHNTIDFVALGKALGDNKSVIRMELKSIDMVDSDAIAIAAGLEVNNVLSVLDMASNLDSLIILENSIGTAGGVAIGNALAKNLDLTRKGMKETV
jgi:hypothetical protein